MTRLWTTVGAACAAAILVGAAGSAGAQSYDGHYYHHRHYRHYRTEYRHRYDRDCWADHHRAANTGTVLGAIGGGIIGSQLAGHGSRTLGTVLGAGGGAVIGHQIGAHSHRCR